MGLSCLTETLISGSSPHKEGSAPLALRLPCPLQTREDESPGSVLIALCRVGEVGGWRGERELRDTPRVSGNKPEAVSVSAWFAGGTQKWLPVACAASVKTLRFLLVLSFLTQTWGH